MQRKEWLLVAVMACMAGCSSDIIVSEICQSCAEDELCCGNMCVKKNSTSHCGSCEVTCQSDETCVDFQCRKTACGDCQKGESCCNDVCTSIQTAENCGACGIQCDGDTPICRDGKCSSSCDLENGELQCDSSCINPMTDKDNCGACGIQCDGDTPICRDGKCSSSCDLENGELQCDSSCINPMTDKDNCGACGIQCKGSCSNGQCDCTPVTCEEQGKNCGTIDDQCGGKLECGSCSDGLTCKANICGCVPRTCEQLALNCGTTDDGCGGTLECGTCADGQACTNNICSCKPKTCAELGINCGTTDNGCGGTLECGTCADGQTCTHNHCGCQPKSCADLGKNCGSTDDGCGNSIQCGSCADGQMCSNNVCKQNPVKDTYPTRKSIKGLQPDFQDTNEVIGNAVHGVAMNLVWESWEGSPHSNCSGNEVLYDGHCFTIDQNTANTIKTYSDAGVVVTAVVYGVPAWCRVGCSGVVAPYFCAPTSEGAQHYGRFVGFLANYFNGENGHGRIADFVIHNEVNSTDWFNYGCTSGTCDLNTWTSVYAESWNAAYDAATKEQKSAKVLISLEHDWNRSYMSNAHPTASGESFLKSLIPKLGNRDWRVAYHSYPPSLVSPAFGANDLGNTGTITFGNIGVLAGWLRQNYPNDPHAWEIQLTENGINGVNSSMQSQQNSQLCQAFRNILGTPGIESFIYHRLVDHPTEVADGLGCGLWAGASGGHPNPAKPAWSTFAFANRSGVADGFPSCGFEDLPYVRMTRSSNSAGMHWITTRQAPSGFNPEQSWRLLREPDNDTVMVYECRVGGVSGNHTMISRGVDCEGQFNMGPMGYVYTKQVPGTSPIYRCYVPGNGSHFVSPASNCEGQTVEQPAPYGYVFN